MANKSFTTDEGITYNNPSAMDSAIHSMKKSFSMDNLSSAASGMGAGLAEGMARKAGGDAMGNAVKAGMASGFNPFVMAGAVALGALKSKQEKERAEKMGDARAKAEKAKGEAKKGDIMGQMSKDISQAFGAAGRQRSWKS